MRRIFGLSFLKFRLWWDRSLVERSDEHDHVKENPAMGVPLLIMSCVAMYDHQILVEALQRWLSAGPKY